MFLKCINTFVEKDPNFVTFIYHNSESQLKKKKGKRKKRSTLILLNFGIGFFFTKCLEHNHLSMVRARPPTPIMWHMSYITHMRQLLAFLWFEVGCSTLDPIIPLTHSVCVCEREREREIELIPYLLEDRKIGS